MGDCQSKKKVEISDEIEEIEIDRDSETQPDQRTSGSKPTSERRATTAPVNLGQTDWSDDESDDEVKVENNDPENDEVTDANKGLIMKLEYHRLL